MAAQRDDVPGATRSDDELIQMIVDAYRAEGLRLSLSQVTEGRARRWSPRPALFAALAAAAALVTVLVVGTALGSRPDPVGPGGTPTASTPGKVRPTTTATADSQRCADIYAQTYSGPPLPPLRFTLTAPDPRLRLLLFGEERHLVGCWLNHDQVTIGGSSVIVDPTDGGFVMQAYGNSYNDPAYFGEPAEYGFGRTPGGATAVEIRFETGDPVQAELRDGWWAWLGVGGYRLDTATELVITTPAGETTHPIRHG